METIRYIIKQVHTAKTISGNKIKRERYIINTLDFYKFQDQARKLIEQKRDKYYLVEINKIEYKLTDIFNEKYIHANQVN